MTAERFRQIRNLFDAAMDNRKRTGLIGWAP